MRGASALILAGSLAAIGCAGASGGLNTARAPLSHGVYVLTSEDMYAWCNLVGVDGNPVDPEGMCQDFRTPPVEVIAGFEARLPRLLAARGHAHVARSVKTYVRQYWGVFRDARIHIVGNFVCRSALDGFGDDPKPMSDRELAHVPIVIDDAGACHITALFPADRPEDVKFQ